MPVIVAVMTPSTNITTRQEIVTTAVYATALSSGDFMTRTRPRYMR